MEVITDKSDSAEQWRKTVNSMVRKGASLKPDDVNVLVEYLAAYFGPDPTKTKIDLNQAEPAEMQKTLGMSAGEAQEILRFRAGGGHFKVWGDVEKMNPALAKKLEPKRDMIAFP